MLAAYGSKDPAEGPTLDFPRTGRLPIRQALARDPDIDVRGSEGGEATLPKERRERRLVWVARGHRQQGDCWRAMA